MQGYIILLNGEVAELVLMIFTIVTEKWLCGGAVGISAYIYDPEAQNTWENLP